MLTITAVIRARAGYEKVVERALRAVVAELKANESVVPGTTRRSRARRQRQRGKRKTGPGTEPACAR